MLTTLYLKSLDAALPHPVLGDRFAPQAVERLDVDWSELGVTARWAPIVTVRTAQYDLWARDFLAAHDQATVVHIGCGWIRGCSASIRDPASNGSTRISRR